jgi:hypothetical protein
MGLVFFIILLFVLRCFIDKSVVKLLRLFKMQLKKDIHRDSCKLLIITQGWCVILKVINDF